MSKRIGKYKVDKRTSALSLVDGGDIKGSLTVTGEATAAGDASWPTNNPVSGSDGNVSVTKATNGGRVTFVPNVSADRTYTLPTPAEGLTFRFVGVPGTADGHDVIFRTTDDTVFQQGPITFLDTDNEVSAVHGNGTSHDQLQVNVPAAFDITYVGRSTTVYYVYGTVTGATAPAFSNA